MIVHSFKQMFKNLNTLLLFFKEPNREFNVREVARIVKIAPATASKVLKELKKNKIVKERQERQLLLYKASLSDEYKDLKIYYNKRKLKDSGLLEELNKFYLKPTIILYGSYSYGLDDTTSDIDILLITEKKTQLDLKKYEKKLGREIHIFIFKSIKNIKNEHLVNNILNGIVLQGKVKWI